MSMNIKNEEAHELARDLAAIEHTTITDAVTLSLREALAQRDEAAAAHARFEAASTVARRMSERLGATTGPSLWTIADDLYDDSGLPR